MLIKQMTIKKYIMQIYMDKSWTNKLEALINYSEN